MGRRFCNYLFLQPRSSLHKISNCARSWLYFANFDLIYYLTNLMETSESQTRLLATDDNDREGCTLCDRCEEKISGRHFLKYKPLLIFGLCQVLFVFFGFIAFALFRRRHDQSILNQCVYYYSITLDFQLIWIATDSEFAKYNVTRNDFGILNAADASEAADQFWKSVTDCMTSPQPVRVMDD